MRGSSHATALGLNNHHGRRNAHKSPTREAAHREHREYHIAHQWRQQKRTEGTYRHTLTILIDTKLTTPGPPHSRLQAEARQRCSCATPDPQSPTNPLRRKLRSRTPREIQTPPPLNPMAHDRRPAIQQMQAACRANTKPLVREQRGQREESERA